MITWDAIAPTENLLSSINWNPRIGSDVIANSTWSTTDTVPIVFQPNIPGFENGYTYIWISGGILNNIYTLVNTVTLESGQVEVETATFVCAPK